MALGTKSLRPLYTFALLTAVTSVWAAPSNHRPCRLAFLAGDFNHSQLYRRRDWGDGIEVREGRPEYLEWMARQANQVSAEYAHQYPPAILSALAESRARLEEKISGTRVAASEGLIFGKWRTVSSPQIATPIGFVNAEPYPENLLDGTDARSRELVLNPFRKRLAALADLRPLTGTLTSSNGEQSSRYRDSEYLATDGTRLAATRILLTENGPRRGLVWLKHTPAPVARHMLADVYRRLERVSQLSGRSALEELARAMHGYYQAMPFERGSASIGAAFFPGIIQSRFGVKVAMPDGVDIHAMMTDTETFLSWLLKTAEMRPLVAVAR